MKFGTVHGRLRPEVGSAKCIGAYGRNGVTPAPRIFGTSRQKIVTPTEYCPFETKTKLFLAYCS